MPTIAPTGNDCEVDSVGFKGVDELAVGIELRIEYVVVADTDIGG